MEHIFIVSFLYQNLVSSAATYAHLPLIYMYLRRLSLRKVQEGHQRPFQPTSFLRGAHGSQEQVCCHMLARFSHWLGAAWRRHGILQTSRHMSESKGAHLGHLCHLQLEFERCFLLASKVPWNINKICPKTPRDFQVIGSQQGPNMYHCQMPTG